MTVCFGTKVFHDSDGLYKLTFCAYMDGFNREKYPIVMFMGHIGVPTKKRVKGIDCFIFYFCVLCCAGYANYSVYVPFGYFVVCMLSDNSFSCFAEKHFKNLTCWLDSQRV